MSLHVPDSQMGYVHADAAKVDRQLREGDGLMWTGDPRLELRMGVVQANRRAYVPALGRYVSRGEIVARRYEVWRHCEDGIDRRIGSWRIEEFDRILMDLAPMRLDAPGRTDTLERIDAGNAAIEKENTDKFRDAAGEMLDHKLRLIQTHTEGVNRHFINDTEVNKKQAEKQATKKEQG